ncbi:ash family protein [Cedecea colo]|uniref:Uncharacterized protein n=1 Tax=Cedecea colo TaxID=2552946 RepID=A0ABX0VNX8_9ENTR|nr:hypothetical protein [Cedecea colo]
MVSLVRQPSGWPVSVVSGISTLISVTTQSVETSVVTIILTHGDFHDDKHHISYNLCRLFPGLYDAGFIRTAGRLRNAV